MAWRGSGVRIPSAPPKKLQVRGSLTASILPEDGSFRHIGRNLGDRVLPDRTGKAGSIIRLVMDTRPGMDGQRENLREPQSGPVVAGLAPQDELETDEVRPGRPEHRIPRRRRLAGCLTDQPRLSA